MKKIYNLLTERASNWGEKVQKLLLNSNIFTYAFRSIPHFIAVLVLWLGLTYGGMYGLYINGDGKGYYAYLPATFIYHDFTFNFIKQTEPKYYPKGAVTDFRVNVNNVPIDKYYAGTAILCMPFFLLAHLISIIFGLPADGYSPVYQYSIFISSVFYLWLGLLYLKKLLVTFNFNKAQIMSCLLLITFASPLIFYTILNPGWSHVYSFAFITIFVYYTKAFINHRSNFHFVVCATVFGFIILIRPINGMVLLSLPFFAGDINRLKETLSFAAKKFWIFLLGVTSLIAIVFIQCIFYYLETGHWMIWSYSGEGFNFFKPHFMDVLFSYRRGLFLYTPLTFLALLGFLRLYKVSAFKALSLFLFLAFVIYAISSWHCWWYGMCFSLRPITEFMPFFAILIGYSLQLKMTSVLRIVYGLTLTFTILYNSIQQYQYKNYILHWDNMDREGFWKVFMHTSDEYRGLLWSRKIKIYEAPPVNVPCDTIVHYNFEDTGDKNITQRTAYGGRSSLLLGGSNHFSPGIQTLYKEAFRGDGIQYYASTYICPLSNIDGIPLHWVLSIENSKGVYEYQSFSMEVLALSKNQWYKTGHLFTLVKKGSPNDIVKLYMWNSSNKKICMDDMVIERYHFGRK